MYECHIPARSKMTWSSRGRSEKWGILLAHSTRVNSCLSAAWQILVTGSFVWRRRPEEKKDREKEWERVFELLLSQRKLKSYMYVLCKLYMNKYKCLCLTELPGLFSVYVSVLGSTASSASRILSTGMSSLKLLVDSTSLSPFSFPRCLSSWTAVGSSRARKWVHYKSL